MCCHQVDHGVYNLEMIQIVGGSKHRSFDFVACAFSRIELVWRKKKKVEKGKNYETVTELRCTN